MHDFASFAVTDRQDSRDGDDDRASMVLIERLDIVEEGALVLVVIEGSHFLWRMVRRMVGVLVAVGRGDIDVAAAVALLKERSDLPARLTAPASGLFLECTFYKGEPRDRALKAITPV